MTVNIPTFDGYKTYGIAAIMAGATVLKYTAPQYMPDPLWQAIMGLGVPASAATIHAAVVRKP